MKNICFLIDHPFDLALFLRLRLILKDYIEFTDIALMTDQSYFKKCESCQDLLSEFDKVVHIQKPQFSRNLFVHFSRSISFIRTLREIDKIQNVFYITANRSELTTQLIMKYSRRKVIRVLQKSNADFYSKSFLSHYRRDIRLRLIRNLYEILLFLPFSYPYRNIDTDLIRYIAYKDEYKNGDLYLENIHSKLGDNEIHFPFFISGETGFNNRKKVYFLGSRFLNYDFIIDDNPAEIINNILRKIEATYGEHVEYIYKPHPLETCEYRVLDLNKFKVVKEINSAEIEYIKFHNEILAVYSIGSTSSKTAFNFGIDSHVVYRMFNLKEKSLQSFNNLFSGLPSDFFIEEMSEIERTKNISVPNVDIGNLLLKLST